ncbi:MAG TPA: RsmE family RNA methyltransferase, partial [Tepidisphaeraceae bacterium]|nr:RsmE family RNA methyltransferase [Tepidisphaeraceae bacterium]
MKRAFVANLRSGSIELDADEAHHLASVLRASVSESIEIFDEFGATAQATIETVDRKKVIVRVDRIEPAPANRPIVSVCTAVPKGERADWMIEKLSEVGCDRLMLLQTSRSVVTPQGQNKWTRWRRITIESAKQCRRVGVMKIRDELLKLDAISDQPVM